MAMSFSICVSIILSSLLFLVFCFCPSCITLKTFLFKALVAVCGVTSKLFISSFLTSKNLNVFKPWRFRFTLTLNCDTFFVEFCYSGLNPAGVITLITGDCSRIVNTLLSRLILLTVLASGMVFCDGLRFRVWIVVLFSTGCSVGFAPKTYVTHRLYRLRMDWFLFIGCCYNPKALRW